MAKYWLLCVEYWLVMNNELHFISLLVCIQKVRKLCDLPQTNPDVFVVVRYIAIA